MITLYPVTVVSIDSHYRAFRNSRHSSNYSSVHHSSIYHPIPPFIHLSTDPLIKPSIHPSPYSIIHPPINPCIHPSLPSVHSSRPSYLKIPGGPKMACAAICRRAIDGPYANGATPACCLAARPVQTPARRAI